EGKRTVQAYALDRARARVDVVVPRDGTVETAASLAPVASRSVVVVVEELPWPDLARAIRGRLDEALLAARRGEPARARPAGADPRGRYSAGGGLGAALRSELGRGAYEIEERLARAGAALEAAAAEPDEAVRRKRVAEVEEPLARSVAEIAEAAARLPARAP